MEKKMENEMETGNRGSLFVCSVKVLPAMALLSIKQSLFGFKRVAVLLQKAHLIESLKSFRQGGYCERRPRINNLLLCKNHVKRSSGVAVLSQV